MSESAQVATARVAEVKLSSQFGLVLRLASLEQRGVGYRDLLSAMEVEAPLDMNTEMVSFGPHFGGRLQSNSFGAWRRSAWSVSTISSCFLVTFLRGARFWVGSVREAADRCLSTEVWVGVLKDGILAIYCLAGSASGGPKWGRAGF